MKRNVLEPEREGEEITFCILIASTLPTISRIFFRLRPKITFFLEFGRKAKHNCRITCKIFAAASWWRRTFKDWSDFLVVGLEGSFSSIHSHGSCCSSIWNENTCSLPYQSGRMLFDKLWLQLISTQLFKLSNAKVSKQLFDPIVRKGSSRQSQRDPATCRIVSSCGFG